MRDKSNSFGAKVKLFVGGRENIGRGGSSTWEKPEGIEIYTPKASKISARLDIIPYIVTQKNHPQQEAGKLWFERTYGVHPGIGVDQKWFTCRKVSFSKSCFLCEQYHLLKKNPDIDDEVAKALKPKYRQLFNVIDLDEKEKGIQLLDISFFNFGTFLEDELRSSDDENVSEFATLNNGMTLKIRWGSKDLGGNSFVVAKRIDFIERKKQYDDDIAEQATDLDALLNEVTNEEMRKEYEAGVEGDDKDEDEEDNLDMGDKKKKGDDECMACEGSGKNSRGKTCIICNGTGSIEVDDEKPVKKHKKPVDADEKDADEEDDADAEEEDEEEEKPVKKHKKPVEENEEDEDEEEEDDDKDEEDEEEEDEKPRHRSK